MAIVGSGKSFAPQYRESRKHARVKDVREQKCWQSVEVGFRVEPVLRAGVPEGWEPVK
jgi:hypothetical protein